MRPEDVAEMVQAARASGERFLALSEFDESAQRDYLPGKYLLVVETVPSPYHGRLGAEGTGYVYLGEGCPSAREVKDFVGGKQPHLALVLWQIAEGPIRNLVDMWNDSRDLDISILREERNHE